MLIIIGFLQIVSGLWALDHKSTSPVANQLMYGSLKAWGWAMILSGVVVVLSGTLVFGRIQLGRWIGIIVAAIAMIEAVTWVFAYPIAALTVIFLSALVLYALIVHGGRDARTS
ncbi:MAG TPA: hypothetical protein VEP49_00395 [Acidimicrobiia bacterium]|nr:hypothetical protein [Acidimicrobiia bacterium]